MGVYIHYDGKSAEPDKLPQLLDRMEVIGQAFGWKTQRITRDISGLRPKRLEFTDGLSKINGVRLLEDRVIGIVFDTGEAGMFEIAFNKEGVIGDYMDITHLLENEANGEKCWFFTPLWACVTGCPQTHRQVCALLRGMKQMHSFRKWKINDSTDYYKTRNERELIQEHMIQASFKRIMSNPEDAKAFMVAIGAIPEDAEVIPLSEAEAKLPPPPKARRARAGRPN